MTYLFFDSNEWWLVSLLLLLLLLSIEIPYRLTSLLKVQLSRNIDTFNVVQTALLTLASFVLGLSFAQASGRFDQRRALIMREANAIGTTWLRADQLGTARSRTFRRTLVDYTDARLRAYQTSPNETPDVVRRGNLDQEKMWDMASAASQARPGAVGLSLLMQSLNETFDVSAEQFQALTSHIPTLVVALTLLLVSLGTLSIGVRFAMDGTRPTILSLTYVAACVIVVTMMVDYDRPQTGFVRANFTPLTAQLTLMEKAR